MANLSTPTGSTTSLSPVNSHNEWDPLEEVIVGRLEGATIPSAHPVVTHSMERPAARMLPWAGGFRQPQFIVGPAQEELDGFVAPNHRPVSR